jgi:AbrB family looped-hinge helix DNA binding protein
MTLPKDVRDQLEVREGDRVAFLREEGRIILRPLTESLLDFRGSIPVNEPQDFAEIRRKTRQERAKKRTDR